MSLAQYPQLANPFSLRQQFIGQPAKAYLAATQALSANVLTKVSIDTIAFDPYASSFNIANHNFVAPATGYYLVNANAHGGGSLSSMRAIVGLNGSNEIFRIGQQSALGGQSQEVVMSGSDFVFLNSGDTLSIFLNLNGAATLFVPVGTFNNTLSAMLLA